jgi:predicted transcriptional regulator
METIVLRLDRDTREKLKLLAEATGCPRSTLVHEAVRRFVDAELAALLSQRNEEAAADGATKEEDRNPSRLRPEHWKIIV